MKFYITRAQRHISLLRVSKVQLSENAHVGL